MTKINYQKKMEEILSQLTRAGTARPKLLLHSCCAPCSSSVLQTLTPHFDIFIHFYNPNISPAEEYSKRLAEQKRLLEEMEFSSQITLLEDIYDPQTFFSAVSGLEQEPEGGLRCTKCFALRLGRAAQKAAELDMDYFTTTLTVSPHKNAALLNELGLRLGEQYQIPFLCSDFKKKEGYKKSILLSSQYNLYRQDYCGCVFSKIEAQAGKQ
jgi:predicted adenine nucleotide alpha hydrolase (AANH) superfamily ATPase